MVKIAKCAVNPMPAGEAALAVFTAAAEGAGILLRLEVLMQRATGLGAAFTAKRRCVRTG